MASHASANRALLLAVVLAWPPASASAITGRVVGVADGDTVTVLDASHRQHKVRLDGIDAPEKAQPFGQRAKQSLSELVFGKVVEVEAHKRDRYGRSVGKVIYRGRDMNLEQLRRGMAWHYKAYAHEQLPKDRLVYSSAEREARKSRRGLWGQADPEPPWEWRKQRSRERLVSAAR